MPHRNLQFNVDRTIQFGPLSFHPTGAIIGRSPGDEDTGGIGGIIADVINQFRFPLPRPRLPRLPPGPGPRPRGRFPIPIPIPIPIPRGFFGGDECPEVACCKGEHVAKTRDPNSPSFGQCVRNRRMNPLNPKALRRAIRRATRFESFVKSNRKSLRKLAKI